MNREAGFTLVELLAAMVAGGLLLASLGWTVSSLGRELARSRDADATGDAAATAALLVTMLEQAYPVAKDGSGFEGHGDGLTALVPPPMAAGDAGPMRLTLRVAPAKGGEGLFARLEPVQPGSAFPAALTGERMLLGGYRAIRFDYADGPAEAPPRLPRLIGLTLTAPDGAVRRISAVPRIDSDGRCRFDPVSMECRS